MKVCCICKKPLDQFAQVEIIPNELYADFTCISDLIPNAGGIKEQRQKAIEVIIQDLISKHKEEGHEI